MWNEENSNYKGKELYLAFLDTVSPEQIRDLTAILISRALAGDIEAARLVLEFSFGVLQEEEGKEDWE